jgi:uncharacterized protein YfaS (alpha-2-macroglobulin family)
VAAQENFEASFKGQGQPWWNLLLLADVPVIQDLNHGLGIEKTWKSVTTKDSNKKTVGDIWEVKLKFNSKSNFQWFALRDPLPPGATIIEDTGAEISEKKAIEYRAYQTWFGGNGEITYRVRLNQSGSYHLPTTRAEAMYNPDIYGEKVNGEITIEP